MIKKASFTCGILYTALILLSVFLGCEVGLGEAVDTQPPALEITYPPTDSTIRDWFVFSGKCSDETSIAKVEISFKEITSSSIVKKSYGPYDCKVNNNTESWSYTANVRPEGAVSYPIPDGSYEVYVKATDNGKRTTTVSKTIVIDNTAPVLVIQNPSTTVSSDVPNKFGQSIKVVGQLADDNAIDKLYFKVYDYSTNEVITTLEEKDIAQNMDIILATYKADDNENPYNKIYEKISDGEHKYKFKVSVSDEARKFQGEKAEVDDNDHGNITTGYYLRKEIYTPVMKGLSLNTKSIYSVMNGSYGNETKTAKIKEELNKYFIPSDATASGLIELNDKTGTFSLNPKNNPTYEISGTDPLDSDFTWAARSKSKSDNILFKLKMGLGESPLRAETFGIKLKRITGAGEEYKDNAGNSVEVVLMKTEEECSEAEKKTRNKKIISEGDNYEISFPVSEFPILSNSTYWEAFVTGLDEDGNDFSNDTGIRYCFLISAGSAVPTITVTEPSSTMLYVKIDDNGVIKGIAKSNTESDEADCTISVKMDGKHDLPVECISYEDKTENGRPFVITIPNELIASVTESTTYTFRITAKDENGQSAYKDINVFYDCIKPSLELTITPTLEFETADDLIGVETGKSYVNGKIGFKSTFSDDDAFRAGTWQILIDGKVIESSDALSQKFTKAEFDTNKEGFDGKKLEFVVTAKDRSGNEVSETKTVYINQETDKPVVKLSNADKYHKDADGSYSLNPEGKKIEVTCAEDKFNVNSNNNLFGTKSNNKLLGTITDDDAISSVLVQCAVFKTDGNYADTDYQVILNKKNVNSSFYSLSASLNSMNQGNYIFVITATDKNGVACKYSFEGVIDDTSATINFADSQKAWKGKKVQLSGTVSNGNRLVRTPSGDPNGTGEQVTLAAGADGKTSTWSDSFDSTLGTLDGDYRSVVYTAYDKYGRSVSEVFVYRLDNELPNNSVEVLSFVSANGKTNNVNGIITIKGTATDNDSVAESKWEILSNGVVKHSGIFADPAIFSTTFDTTNLDDKKDYTVRVTSKDKSGNEGKSETVIFVDQDTDKPVISFSNAKTNITSDESISNGNNLFDKTGNNKLLGTVSDDDGLDKVIIEYSVDKDAESWKIIKEIDCNGITSQGFDAELPSDIAEGVYYVRYTVKDIASKKNGKPYAQTNGLFVIGVDNGIPSISVTTQSGAYAGAKSTYNVTGTASDGNTFTLVRYAVDPHRNPANSESGFAGYGTSDEPVTINVDSNGAWTDTFQTTNNGDEFIYKVVDRFKRENKATFSYKIDSVKPVVDVTIPSLDNSAGADNTVYIGTTLSTTYIFRGSAYDPEHIKAGDKTPVSNSVYEHLSEAEKELYTKVDASGISLVEYEITGTDGLIATGTASGTTGWSANVDFANESGVAYANASTIKFRAVDGGGLKSEEVSRNVVVDNAVPVILFDKTTGFTVGGTAVAAVDDTYYTNKGFVITGSIADSNFKSLTCNSTDGTVAGTGSDGAFEKGDDGKYKFTYTVSGAVTEGMKNYVFTATDKAGQTSDLTVSVRVDKTAPTNNFSVSTFLTATEKDAENKDVIRVDVVNGKITVEGTARDTYTVVSSKLVIKNSASSEIYSKEWTGDNAASFGDVINTAELNGENPIFADKKEYKIYLISKDRAGNIFTSEAKTIFVDQDTDKPAVEFSNMITTGSVASKDNLFGIGITSISANASDDDGISKITYKIGSGSEVEYYKLAENETVTKFQSIKIDLKKALPQANGKPVPGEYKISIKVYDINDFATTQIAQQIYSSGEIPFGYDAEDPVITVSTVAGRDYQKNMFVPATFSVVGAAKDDYKVVKVFDTADTANPKTNLFSAETNTWTESITAADGDLTRTFTVEDFFGRSYDVSVSVKVDITAPEFVKFAEDSKIPYRNGYSSLEITDGEKTFTDNIKGTSESAENDNPYWIGKVDASDNNHYLNWFKVSKETVSISGKVNDVNFNKVELKVYDSTLAGTDKYALKSTLDSNEFKFTYQFANGEQKFKLVAYDLAQNSKEIGPFSIFIDNAAPTISSVSDKIKNSSEADESKWKTLTSESIVKCSETIKLYINAKDAKTDGVLNSGIRSVQIGSSNGFATALAETVLPKVVGLDSDADLSIEVPLAGLTDGDYKLYARVIDDAGNYADADTEVASFRVDNTLPVVTITSHLADATATKVENRKITLNKTVVLSGSVIESNMAGDAKPVLYYAEKPASGSDLSWAAAPTTGSNVMVSEQTVENGQWSLKLDTTKLDNTVLTKDFYLAVEIADKAGNVNVCKTADVSTKAKRSEKILVTVDQDSDRPVITFSNVTLSNAAVNTEPQSAMTETNRVWIKKDTIHGSVTDDDGVKSVEYSTDGINFSAKYEDAEKVEREVYSNGLWELYLADGSTTVWFRVTDEEDGEFTSSVQTGIISLTSPKLKDVASTPNYYGYRAGNGVTAETNDYTTILYSTVDTSSPSIDPYYYAKISKNGFIVKTNSEGNEVETTVKPAEMTVEKIVEMNSLKREDFEDAGWKSLNQVSSEVFGGPESKFYVWTKATDANGIASLKMLLDNEEQTCIQTTTVAPSGSKAGYNISLFEISTAKGNNNVTLAISAKDAAGGTSTENFTLILDNTPPVVSLDSHKDKQTVFGSLPVTVSGTTSDAHNIEKFYYLVSETTDTPEASKFTEISQYSSLINWNVTFDDNISLNKDGGTAFHDKILNKYITAYTNDEKYETLTELYFWYYAVDIFGNATVPAKRILTVNPQADKPTIEITYPANKPDGSLASVGGTIRVTGGSTISASEIDSVWLQIDPTYEGNADGAGFSDNWETEMTEVLKAAGSGNQIQGETLCGYKIESATVEGTTVKGIKADNTSFWSKAINTAGELQSVKPTDDKGNITYHDVAIRAFALSKTGKKSDDVTVVFNVDPDNPLIGNSKELRLVQYVKDAQGKDTDTEARSIKYTSDMWITGLWYLEGSVEDTSGIKKLTVMKGNTPDILVSNQTVESGSSSVFGMNYADMVKQYTNGEYKGYTFKIPVGDATDDSFGKLTYSITGTEAGGNGASTTQEISLNYDNKAPEFAAELNAIGNIVVQSNFTYTINGTFDETGAGGENQSGFDKIAMYFTRTLGTGASATTYVIDPMVPMGDDGTLNRTLSTTFDGGKVASDGLYWVKATTTKAVNSSTISVSVPANARKGGLCKVNDVIYTIDSVSVAKDSVTLKSTPATTSGAVDIYFATAQVIDNQTIESGTTAVWKDAGCSISNDDGDQMVEGVSHSGALYNWTVSIDSSNIYDGPIEIHFVAFDKAGMSTSKKYSGTVKNNAPRIARVTYGTDTNGNNSVEPEEMTSTALYKYTDRNSNVFWGRDTDSIGDENKGYVYSLNIGSAFESKLTIKGATKVIPEIVGGNGGLGYSYKVNENPQKILKYNKEGKPYKDANGEIATEDLHDYNVENDVSGLIRGSTKGMEDTKIRDGLAINIPVLEMLVNSSSYNKDTIYPVEFTIWDKTEGSEFGSSTEKAVITLYSKIAITSGSTPVIKINPFHWNSSSDNSLYLNSTAQGHIELEDDWKKSDGYKYYGTQTTGFEEMFKNTAYDEEPKTSGIIVFDGTSTDDVMLERFTAAVAGVNSGKYFEFAKRNEDGSWLDGSTAENSSGTWTKVEVIIPAETSDSEKAKLIAESKAKTVVKNLAANGWASEIVSETIGASGNEITWKFYFNTAHKIVAAKDVTVDIMAYNRGSAAIDSTGLAVTYTPANSSKDTAITTKTQKTSHYRMDVVPYVTKVETNLSKQKKTNWSVYNRTALGHYPVQSVVSNVASGILNTTTSENVILHGFNLNGTVVIKDKDNTTMTATANGLAVTAATATALSQIKFNVANLASGPMNFTVNDITAINNLNSNDAKGTAVDAGTDNCNKYNMQPNRDTNNILTDDLEFDVWEFNDRAAKPINGTATGVQMQVNQDSKMLNFAFANGGLFYSMGGKVSGTNYSSYYWAGDWDTFAGPSVGFTVDNLGYTYSVASGGDTNNSGSVDKYDLYTSRWGLGNHGTNGTLSGNRSRRIEEIAIKTGTGTFDYSLMKYRYLSSELAASVSGTTTNLYLVNYDALTDEIRFRAGAFANNTVSNNGGFVDEYTNGNSYWYSTTNCQVIANNSVSGGSFPADKNGTTTVAKISGRGAGQYVDIAVAKNGTTDVACVVWFDAYDNCLKYTYSVDPVKNWDSSHKGNRTAKGWSTPITIFSEGGEYCQIVVDKNNHIHIAAYAGNGDVKYAYLQSYNSTYTESENSCTVDASGSVGEHLTLDVALDASGNSIPYIGYFTSAIKAPKYAYLVDTSNTNKVPEGVDDNERFTGKWEVTVVPTPSRLTTNREDKINIGVFKKDGVLNWSTNDGKEPGSTNIGKSTCYSITGDYSSSKEYSQCYGNGTKNAVFAYQISGGSGSCIETAQMR